jgi:hypothetical protein
LTYLKKIIKNPEVEENKEDYDLDSVTDLPDLGPEFEIEGQGDEVVVIAVDKWGD